MATYKLYATKKGEIPDGVEFSLRPYGADYLLVFTDKELGKPFVEIPPETPLTEQEQQFVTRCKLVINKRHLEDHQKEYHEALDEFLDALEQELKAENAKVEGEKKADK